MTDSPLNKQISISKLILLLSLTAFFTFGQSFNYDVPQELEQPFSDYINISSKENSYLYSIYSLPNLVLNILGGIIIVKFGLNNCLIIFICCNIVGSLISALGVYYYNYWVIMLGRFVYGCGAENLIVAQYITCNIWFKGKFLSVANTLCICAGLTASIIAFYIVPEMFIRY
jgi:MFS family permease